MQDRNERLCHCRSGNISMQWKLMVGQKHVLITWIPQNVVQRSCSFLCFLRAGHSHTLTHWKDRVRNVVEEVVKESMCGSCIDWLKSDTSLYWWLFETRDVIDEFVRSYIRNVYRVVC